ncbi:MAG: hypothetical protein U1B30_08615, partial [Pseudomonadota bacterium]|nr:hypothetical protein [Pseudomonadota bacterium]
MISRVLMAGLIAGMLIAGVPGVFAEEPAAPVEAAKPDPAKAKEELAALIKAWLEAKVKGDKKAITDASDAIDKWKKDNAALISTAEELAVQIVDGRQMAALGNAYVAALKQA